MLACHLFSSHLVSGEIRNASCSIELNQFAFIEWIWWANINKFVGHLLVKSDTFGTGSERRSSSSNRGVFLNSSNIAKGREPGSLGFTIEEIYKATRTFSPSFKIGQGGFGTVYKGRLADGSFVAIKRAKKVRWAFSCLFCFLFVFLRTQNSVWTGIDEVMVNFLCRVRMISI